MRPVCAILLAILCAPAHAVTLVLQFDQAYSQKSLHAMEDEVASIVSESGIQVDWRLLTDVHSSESFESLVVVHFHGACNMESKTSDQRDYYGLTYVTEGTVLPFSEVECDKISGAIRPEMSKKQWREPDSILGRALGRVVAHELFHMVVKSEHHAVAGVTKSSLSPAQLISNKLSMAHADLDTLKKKDAR